MHDLPNLHQLPSSNNSVFFFSYFLWYFKFLRALLNLDRLSLPQLIPKDRKLSTCLNLFSCYHKIPQTKCIFHSPGDCEKSRLSKSRHQPGPILVRALFPVHIWNSLSGSSYGGRIGEFSGASFLGALILFMKNPPNVCLLIP